MIKNLYDIDFNLFNDSEEDVQKILTEIERRKEREMALAKE